MTATRVDPKGPSLADEAFRDQNAALLTDLGLAIIDDPSILDQIPDGAMLVLLPADADEGFVKRSVETGIEMLHRGHNVYFRHLAPGEWRAADRQAEDTIERNGAG